LDGILGFRSGIPYTPTVGRDVANTGVGSQRPNRIGPGELENPTLDLYFDKSAFVVALNFMYGNSGGSILRRDYLGTFDFSLHKEFSVTERSRLQFRADAFNLQYGVLLRPEFSDRRGRRRQKSRRREQPAPDAVRTEVQLLK
jgi:hypothetical protein